MMVDFTLQFKEMFLRGVSLSQVLQEEAQ